MSDHSELSAYPPFQLIVDSCRQEADPNVQDLICHTLQASGSNRIRDLSVLASRHGVLPLVYKTLSNLPGTVHSSSRLLSKLESAYQTIARRNMLLSAELLRIVRLFESSGITCLPFKGPTLALRAYGDITLRQYGDLDLLVPPEQISEAAEILSAHGYRSFGSLTLLNDPVWLEAAKDMVFQHQKSGVVVELHWKLFHRTFADARTQARLWTQPDQLTLQRHTLPVLPDETLLTYLCIHGARHLWERLEWIVDIDRLIRNRPIDWAAVDIQAETFRARKMLYLALSLSHRFFTTPLPEEILRRIRNKKIRRLTETSALLVEKPISSTPSLRELLLRHRLHAAMQETPARKIQYWRDLLFMKNYTAILKKNDEREETSLYDPIRPLRLIGKFLFRIGRS